MRDFNESPPTAIRRRHTEIEPAAGASGILTLAVGVVVLGALYFGRDIFVPLALAILLSFALTPPVRWLRRRRLGRIPSVLIVVILAFITIFGFGAFIGSRVADLAESLPLYQRNIEAKIRSVQDAQPGGGLFERASSMLRDLGKQISDPEEEAKRQGIPMTPAEPEAEEEPEPIPVQIQQPELKPLEILQRVIGPMIEPLTTGGLVIVVVIFMLLQREDLRDRVIHLAGGGDLQRTTQALDEAMRRVARYLLMQLVVNTAYAVPVGIGLWLIGVPNSALWAMLALVLRFVPYIGPIVAAVFPLALSIAVDPGWSMLLWTAALFIMLELITNNFLEPWLYGTGTGLSPMAVIVAAVFWTWLWGPVGLLLSTPLTVCLVVLGRHVPQLEFLYVLLGNQPVLTQEVSLYQRLLAADPHEAAERAEEYLADHPLSEFYDDVAIPALALAEQDRVRGTLDDQRREIVADSAMTLVDVLADHADLPDADDDVRSKSTKKESDRKDVQDRSPAIDLPLTWQDNPVLCIAGRGNLDEAAGAMLAQLLQRHGIGVRVAPASEVQSASLTQLDIAGIQMVCISYMNAESAAHARYLVRRIRRTLPKVSIIIGLWTASLEESAGAQLLARIGADVLATSLEEAIGQILSQAASQKEVAAGPVPDLPAAAKATV